MQKMLYFLAVMVILAGAVGCNLPASQAPAATPTSQVPFPVATNNALVQDILRQTQTAAAMLASPVPTQAATQAGTQGALSTLQSQTTANPTLAGTLQASTMVAYSTPTPGHPASWTVHKGEFCYCLARRYNIDPSTLINANPVCKATLSEGSLITIPSSAAAFPGTRALLSHPTTYTVRYGDTIYSIGCYYGDVDPMTLAAANGLKSPYTLTAGQKLNIP